MLKNSMEPCLGKRGLHCPNLINLAMEYHPKFRALRALLSKIPNINHGGCAIAALAMYQVGKEVGMNVQIMYLYDHESDSDFQNNRYAIYGLAPISECCHAICVVDNTALDSRYEISTSIYPYKHFVPEEFVINSLKEDIWNKQFDRNLWLPRIEMFLGKRLPI